MKKTTYSYAKHKRFSILVYLAVVAFLNISCGGSGGNDPPPVAQLNPVVAKIGPDRTGIVTQNMDSPNPEEILFFDASASAGNEYAWSVIVSDNAAANFKLTSNHTRATGFYADQPGNFTVQMRVSDSAGNTETDTANIRLIEDADADGIIDAEDPDRDGDGFINTADLFPDDRSSHYDTDLDGVGNYYEDDVDGDGVDDINDDFPMDPTASLLAAYSETKESSASNQNDGILVSETAGSAPLKISGAVTADQNKPDLDYFKIAFSAAGRYSLLLSGADAAMRPVIALMDQSGNPMISTDANTPFEAGSTAQSVLIQAPADYYLSVTDLSGNSAPGWIYSVKIVIDEDLDGVQDELERALDSNEFTADSDSDGIPDYVEIREALKDWFTRGDPDNDGIPSWWDSDSDQDGLSDSIEYVTAVERPDLSAEQIQLLNDADADGRPNFLDSDSDGNGISDTVEAGVNPAQAENSDSDLIPDFIDVDDDNDGLLDVNESAGNRLSPLTPTWSPAGVNQQGGPVMIRSVINTTLKLENVATGGDQMLLTGNAFPLSADQASIILKGANNILNLKPTTVDADGFYFTWPEGISRGVIQLMLSYAGEVTNSLAVVSGDNNSPVITNYRFTGNQVTFEGVNLDANLTVFFSGASIGLNNSNGSANSFQVSKPADAITGLAYVNTIDGDSNSLYLEFLGDISGSIQLPAGLAIDLTTLDVSWSVHPDNEINPDAAGNFTTRMNLTGPSIVSALIAEPTSDGSFKYAVLLEALTLAGDTFVNLNSQSTALAMVWSAIGVQETVAKVDYVDARTLLAGLTQVQALGNLLEQQLVTDPYIRNKPDNALLQAANAAIVQAVEAIEAAIGAGTLAPKTANRLSAYKASNRSAVVMPLEVDDIMVYEHENSGKITVENDSELYLSVQITGKDNTLLAAHITGLTGMVGIQDYWGTADTKTFDQTKKRDSIVQVITPGTNTEFDPKRVVGWSNPVYTKLTIRTVVERILLPTIGTVISLGDLGPGFNPVNFSAVLISDATDLGPAIEQFAAGKVGPGMKALLSILYYDLQKVGPITKGLFNTVGRGAVTAVISKMAAKTVARLAAKLSPVGGLLGVIDVLSIASNVTHVGKTITDILTTDNIIEFDVDFPMDIDQVIPGKVKADGKNKTFTIKGEGFSPIVTTYGLGYWSITHYPEVSFIDTKGNEFPIQAKNISADGTEMVVTVAGWWLDDYIEGPLKVALHHPTTEPDSRVEKDPAVVIVDAVEISSIDPSKGGKKVAATVYGAGFSNIISDNDVMVGFKIAALSHATETSLGIIIPDLEKGIYDVEARVRFDGVWSDWSNTVPYEVIESQVQITVCDNGGLKDDAFTLYVDGKLTGTLYAVPGAYCATYNVDLSLGDHTAMLQGVEAPDSVGTYSIVFSGVSNLSGDATSGNDLVPGVKKSYRFSVQEVTAASKPDRLLEAFPYQPEVQGQEVPVSQ